MRHEHAVGIGFLTPLLALAGLLARRRNPGVRLILVVSALLVLVTTLFGDFTLWKFIYTGFPGAKAVRAVARIGLFLLIPAAVGLAHFVQDLTAKHARWAVLLGFVCLGEQGITTSSFDKGAVRDRVAAIAARVPPQAKAFYLTTTDPEVGDGLVNIDALWVQLLSGVPTVNGYVGITPPGYGRLGRCLVTNPKDLEEIESDLRAWATQHGLRREDLLWIPLGAMPFPAAGPARTGGQVGTGDNAPALGH